MIDEHIPCRVNAFSLILRPDLCSLLVAFLVSANTYTLPVHFAGVCLYTAYTLGVYTMSLIFLLCDNDFHAKPCRAVERESET
jgi:hypothetical protein